MNDVFCEWLPYRVTIRPPTPPAGGSWAQVDAFQQHLAGLGLADPTRVAALLVAARHVRDAATVSLKSNDVDDDVERVAKGEMTADEALRRRAKRPDSEEMAKAARRRQDDAEALTRDLLHRAAGAIFAYGWIELLGPVVAEALKRRDETTWRRAHAFAEWLRSEQVGIRALSAALASNVADSDWWLYATGDGGRGVFLWQVEHCEPGQAVPGQPMAMPGGSHVVPFALKTNVAPPSVTDFAEHAEEWGGVGLFTAEQVVENMNRSLAAQDREIDALMHPEAALPRHDAEREQPQGKKSRMAVT